MVGASQNSYKCICIFYMRLYGLYKTCINPCPRSINCYTCILVYIFYTCIKNLKKYRPGTCINVYKKYKKASGRPDSSQFLVDPTINRLLLGYHAPVEGKAELQGGSSDPSRGGEASQWGSRHSDVALCGCEQSY